MNFQKHGFDFEDRVIQNITKLTKEEYQNKLTGKYTSSMDIVKNIHSKHDYSIKVSKNGNGIGGGDILRFNKHCRDGFKLVIGCWKQINSTTKRFYTVYEFDIRENDYHALWGNLTEESLLPFVSYVKGIPAGKEAQKKNKTLWKEKRQKLYDTYGRGVLDIAAKIDSKNQRRVQCSFTVQNLIDCGVRYKKYDAEYRGISLPYEEKSKPRQFSKT